VGHKESTQNVQSEYLTANQPLKISYRHFSIAKTAFGESTDRASTRPRRREGCEPMKVLRLDPPGTFKAGMSWRIKELEFCTSVYPSPRPLLGGIRTWRSEGRLKLLQESRRSFTIPKHLPWTYPQATIQPAGRRLTRRLLGSGGSAGHRPESGLLPKGGSPGS
jgi:hypothetical protein